MQTKILSIFTCAPLHIGCGSSVGTVDMPIMRERHTAYPIIPGTAIKGVLADLWIVRDGEKFVRDNEGIKILGSMNDKEAKAGALLVGEGKLLAFPVRSAKNCWAWITCPFVLSRAKHDCNCNIDVEAVVEKLGAENNTAIASTELTVKGNIILEEYPSEVVQGADDILNNIIEGLRAFGDNNEVWKDNLKKHFAIVSDDLFAYFVKNACEIANHNAIDDETGVVKDGALFSQENVPSEAMFYSVLNCFDKDKELDVFGKLDAKLKEQEYLLQIGADVTTGLGWCATQLLKK